MATVFIPTRQRPELLERCIRSWEQFENIQIVIAVEPGEPIAGEIAERVHILRLPKRDQGVGYARHHIVRAAVRASLRSFFMCDDDHYPVGDTDDSDLELMLRFAKRKDVLGVGAWKHHYLHFMPAPQVREASKERRATAFLARGGLGYQLIALNTANAMDIGNFDKKLNVAEDQDLCRRGMLTLHLPWYVWTGVHAGSRSANRRGNGGIDSLPRKREKLALESFEILQKRYPGSVFLDGGRMRNKWKEFYLDNVDGPWPPEEHEAGDRPYDWEVTHG
jgi:hypothetical protein